MARPVQPTGGPGRSRRVASRRQVARSPRAKTSTSPRRPATTWATPPRRVAPGLDVGEHDLLAVGPAVPSDAGVAPHRTLSTPSQPTTVAGPPSRPRPASRRSGRLGGPLAELDAVPRRPPSTRVPGRRGRARAPPPRPSGAAASGAGTPYPAAPTAPGGPAPCGPPGAGAPRRGVRQGQEVVGDAERPQHLQGPGVDDHGPRRPERLGPRLDDRTRAPWRGPPGPARRPVGPAPTTRTSGRPVTRPRPAATSPSVRPPLPSEQLAGGPGDRCAARRAPPRSGWNPGR